jgi:hypothetical protein
MTVDYAAAALAAARRYCGWVVTPATVEDATVDGPGSRVLTLRTLQLNTITAVIEDDVTLDVDDLRWSVTGEVFKKSGRRWSCNPGAITVTMEHGYAAAPDFDAAVAAVAAGLAAATIRDDAAQIKKKVDDVEYDWDASAAAGVLTLHKSLLDPYRILISP